MKHKTLRVNDVLVMTSKTKTQNVEQIEGINANKFEARYTANVLILFLDVFLWLACQLVLVCNVYFW